MSTPTNGSTRLAPEAKARIAQKMQMRREMAALSGRNPLGGNKRAPIDGAPRQDLEGCDETGWEQPKPSGQLMALVKGIKSGTMSDDELAMRLQQAMACPIESPSGSYKDILGFLSASATANNAAGSASVLLDESFVMHRLVIGDELTIGVTITDVLVNNRNQFTNVSAVANAGFSASIFSSLNPCPLSLDFPSVPGGLTITVEYFNASGAVLALAATGYGQAYGC